MLEMDVQLHSGKDLCEFCVQQLTNEEISQLVSNYEELLNKLMGYQEQILSAITIISPFSDEIKKSEKKAYE